MKNSWFILSLLFLISCANPVPRKPIISKSSSLFKESVELNKKLNSEEEETIRNYIKNDTIQAFQISNLGFWYAINLKSDTKIFPKFGDKVVYFYEVKDLQNNVIYSEEEIGEKTYFIDQQDVIEGLRNGLKIMNEGDEFTFIFPSYKAYGLVGDNNKIGINKPVIYKVKLKSIIKNESN